jgi:hypothetical protein
MGYAGLTLPLWVDAVLCVLEKLILYCRGWPTPVTTVPEIFLGLQVYPDFVSVVMIEHCLQLVR